MVLEGSCIARVSAIGAAALLGWMLYSPTAHAETIVYDSLTNWSATISKNGGFIYNEDPISNPGFDGDIADRKLWNWSFATSSAITFDAMEIPLHIVGGGSGESITGNFTIVVYADEAETINLGTSTPVDMAIVPRICDTYDGTPFRDDDTCTFRITWQSPITMLPNQTYYFRIYGEKHGNLPSNHQYDSAPALYSLCYFYIYSNFYPLQCGYDTRAVPIVRFISTAPSSPPVSACCSNVLFLPGIESSRLYGNDGSGEKKLWEPAVSADAEELAFGSDGISTRSDIYTRDVIDNAYFPLKGDVYKDFIADMNALKQSGTINDWEPIAYDWRLAPAYILDHGANIGAGISYLAATSSPYIIQELRRLAASSQTGKVTIVAHSDGGLIAKAMMQQLGDAETAQLIDKVIFVAVPQIGTPSAISGLLHGYKEGINVLGTTKISDAAARQVGDTLPGLYYLLPSASYFTYVDDPVAAFSSSTLPQWAQTYGDVIHSVDRLVPFLTDKNRTQPSTADLTDPTTLPSDFVQAAEQVHETLDAWVPPSGVQVIQIAGWGVPTTVSAINYSAKVVNGQKVLDPQAATVIDGDGTVITPSALWLPSNLNVSDFWLNLDAYNKLHPLTTLLGFANLGHANILEVPELRSFILDTIKNSVQPLLSYNYVTTSTPPSHDIRLRFSLHSPLSLNLYDDQGRHTGISTSTGETEEEIPGTYYMEFGDTKYIFSDASSSLHVALQGYETGAFTLNIDELAGNTRIASTTFQDIPTTPHTAVTLDLQDDISTISPLHLDENGDGKYELNIPSVSNGIATFDNKPPVTTFDATGTLGTHGWYTSQVFVTLNATDTESGVKATYYSLDGSATTSGNSLAISADGVHQLIFYSEDTFANAESPHSVTLKIDTSAPEFNISGNLTTKDLNVSGIDSVSSTTVTTSQSIAKVSDESGHKVTLTFKKHYNGKLIDLIQLSSISYDGSAAIPLNAAIAYVWLKQVPISQTITIGKGLTVEAIFDQKKDRTLITIKKKGLPAHTQTLPGLVLLQLETDKGEVNYRW